MINVQDFYRCDPGYEELADQVARQACVKLVKDLYYEARIQSMIDYHGIQNVQLKNAEARTMTLSREQYMQVLVLLALLTCHLLGAYYIVIVSLLYVIYLLCRRYRLGARRTGTAGPSLSTSGAAMAGCRSTLLVGNGA